MDDFEEFTRQIINYMMELYLTSRDTISETRRQQLRFLIQEQMDDYKSQLDIETSLNVRSNYIVGEENEEEEEEDVTSASLSSPIRSPRFSRKELGGKESRYIRYSHPSSVDYEYIPIPRWPEIFGKGSAK